MLGPQKGYIDILDEALIEKKKQEQSEPQRFNPLRPSSAGYCERALGYAYNEYLGNAQYPPEEINPDSIRLLELGHSIEYSFIKQLQYTKLFQIKYKQQAVTFVQLDEKTLIEGSIDLCLYFEEHRCIADVKSKGTRFSWYRGDSWEQTDADITEWSSVKRVNDRLYWIEDLDLFLKQCNDPWMADNFYQLNLYACTDFMKERGVDHAVLFYYEKNKSRLREIRFKPSDDVAKKTTNKFIKIHSKVIAKDIDVLKRESELGSVRCSYCRFASVCRPGIDSQKAYFETWPERENPIDVIDEAIIKACNLIKGNSRFIEANEVLETQITIWMEQNKIKKMRLPDGEVYECKFLKTPKPHLELRRSK